MANRYYRSGTLRATQVRALFSAIAPRYDLINDLQSLGLHRLWKRQLAQAAKPQPGERALDLCCGTGDVAFQLARSGAHTIGVDFSMPMLDIARRRQMRSPTTTWLVAADGQRLPFPNATFEVLTISYGLRNLPDFESGLREMARVTKPDGRLVVLDFALPSARPWRAVYLAYLHAVVPALGWLFCGNAAAYAYILESLRNYPNPAGITALLNHTGWTSVQSTPLLGGVMSLHHARRQTKPRDQIERTQV
jgi:demethylmenaquinone methyltransferase / 2-methoxy-6-polyprenyl-1,4-benzoquinol methylase